MIGCSRGAIRPAGNMRLHANQNFKNYANYANLAKGQTAFRFFASGRALHVMLTSSER